MPTLAPLALARPDWVSTAEQRLYALLTTGQPAPVDILVAELADTLHITVELARREAEHHLDLAGILNSGPTSPSGTPFIRTVGQTPKAALLNWGSPTASPTGPEVIQRTRRRARTEGHLQVPAPGSPPSEVKVEIKPIVPSKISVAVVAPGAGTGINGAIYSELGRNPSFKVEVVGRSRAAYDVYPPCWPHGAPAPNLMSFAEEVLETRVHTQVQTMVFGSRGGQVVLPHMWQAEAQGLSPPVPPVVVINGGCAMKLPSPVFWPDYAVSFLLIGGNDNFRGRLSRDDYVAETRSHVPPANKTTAILFVNEMTHMPQQPLLRGVLKLMLKAISSWKADGKVPLQFFRDILAFLRQDGWSGRLLYTTAPGAWEDIAFSSFDIDKLQVQGVVPVSDESLAPEFTAKDEVKALWRAAVVAATGPSKGHRLVKANVVEKTDSTESAPTPTRLMPTLPISRGSEALQVPCSSGYGGHGPYATPDATPISRTLGLPGRAKAYSGYSTPQSCHSAASSVSPQRSVFFAVPDASPKRVTVVS